MAKMGRPTETGIPLGPGRFVRLPQDVDDLVLALSSAEDRPIGRIIRQLIREGLAARGLVKAQPTTATKLRHAG